MLGEHASVSDKEQLRSELGLDRPIARQLSAYAADLSRLDLGRSLHTRSPVTESLARGLPPTLLLSAAALILALAWGLPLGVMAGVHRGSLIDGAAYSLAILGMSTPAVFLGPLLIYFFALTLGWFPVSGSNGFEGLVLPAVSLAIPLGSAILRISRVAVLEVLEQDYIRTAKAKGLAERIVYFKHALGNAMIPIVTISGLQLGAVLTGTVVTETIFDWPGLGSLLYGSIQRRDYPVVQACVLTIAAIYVLVNLLTDLAYGLVNPRIRKSEDV